jgi:OOP family OmpA-OmpF porin
MTLTRWGTLGLLAVSLATGPAAAEDLDPVQGRIFEISPLAGFFLPDENIHYKSSSPLFGLRGSLNNSSLWSIEAEVGVSPAQQQNTRTALLRSYNAQPAYNNADDVIGVLFTDLQTSESVRESASNLFLASGSVLFHLSRNNVRPFVLAGAGFIDDISNSDGSPPSPFSNLFLQGGFGVRYLRKSGWGARVEFRDMFFKSDRLPRDNPRAVLLAAQNDVLTGGVDGVFGREPFSPVDYRGERWLNNFASTASLTIPFGFAWKDGDGDEVVDRFDNCLTTAPGVVVNTLGCGLDTDADGVFDGLDDCEGTPIGATVDRLGCPSDEDGDGVLDGLDVANDTPPGALVDAQGQHFDTDGDGVWDGLDHCNDTPLGAAIDENGCSNDPLEEKLLRGEPIVVANVEFEGTTSAIEPLSYHYINKAAQLIERWTGNADDPRLIEIGVYTDGIGSEEYNRDLTQRRADALRTYMLENFLGMGANNLVAVGYGESRAIASDQTEEGRRINRRIEVRKLGPGAPPEPYDFGGSRDAGAVDRDLEELLNDAPDLPSLPDEPEMPDALDDLPPEPEMPDLPE